MNKLNPIVFCCLFLAVVGLLACRTPRKTSTTLSKIAPTRSAGAVMLALDAATKTDFEWFSSKLALDIQSPDFNGGADGMLRIQQDSAIFLLVKKFGFEVARVRITPDSLHAIVAIQNSYVAEDISFLSEKFGMPARFDWLQALFLGQALWPLDSTMMRATSDSTGYQLMGENAGYAVNYEIDAAVSKLLEAFYRKTTSGEKVLVTQSQWGLDPNQRQFPYLRTWALQSKSSNIDLELQFSELSFAPQKPLRFEIPADYARIRP